MIDVIQELRDAYKLLKAVRRNNMQHYDIKFIDTAMDKIKGIAEQLKEQGDNDGHEKAERD